MNDGGPAFPCKTNSDGNSYLHTERDESNGIQYSVVEQPGMSLRDYFAAHSDIPWNVVFETLSKKYPERNDEFTVKEIAEYRAAMKYVEADSMLKERATQTTK
jgi:hypothetical protein